MQLGRIWETPLKQTLPYSNLRSQNWTESGEEVQNNIIKCNPNVDKQKFKNLNSSKYENKARYKSNAMSMFISVHFLGHMKDKEVYFFR